MADLPDWMSDGSTQTAPSPQPAGALPDWMNADASGPAKESIRLSQDIAPDHAAKVLNIAGQTGLPTGFVSRNADALQKQADNAAITPQFSKDHPVTTAYVGEDPHQAAVAGSDIPVLGAIERQFQYMANQTERGGLDVERQFRGMLKGFGYDDPSNDERIAHIQGRLQGDLNQAAPGPISNIFGKVAESAPMLAGALGIGAAATAASIPAVVAAGGTAAAFGALEFGNSYLDFSQRKDAAGNPAMTSNEARGFSLISGALNGAMFMVPAEKMLKNMPGLRMLTGDGIRSLISSPTALEALRGVAADIGKTGLTMGGFSGMSSLVHSVAGHLGEIKGGSVQPNSPSEFISALFPKEDLKSAAESAASGAVTGGIIGGVEGGVGSAGDYRNYTKSMEAKDVYYAQKYKQAQDTAQGWTNIGNALQGTKMSEVAPAEVNKLVSRMVPDSHVYIPMEHWQSYWEGEKADPRAAYLAAVGDTKSYDESLRTGADLQVPAGKYAASIAPSDHAEFFNNVLRADPLAMSAEDAKQSLGMTKDIEKEEAADKIKGAVAGPNIPEPLPMPEKEPITPAPEIRATQNAQDVQGIAPLFPRPTAEGMSADMAGKYRQAIDTAKAKAQEDIARDIIDASLKQKSAAWLKERSGVQDQVRSEVESQPGYIASDSFKKHMAPDGSELSRLSASDIEKDFPEFKGQMPDDVSLKSGGLHPDDAAMRLGYDSGSELLHDLATLPDKESTIQRMTDERMMERHPEIAGENIVDKAMDAVHNQDRSKVLRLELQHLASDDFASFKGLIRKIGRRVPTLEEVRTDAESTIGEKTIGETSSLLYQRAEAISSREAQEHFLRGDFEKAFEAKKQELINHELYRAAKNAKEQTAKDVSFAKKFESDSSRARLGKAGGTYLNQIDAIRQAFDFSPITGKDLDKIQSLREWLDSQQKEGFNPIVPPDLLDQAGKKSWRELTNDKLHTTVDSMRNIAHLAGLKNELLAALKKRTFQETIEGINNKLTERFNLTSDKLRTPLNENPELRMKIKTGINKVGAWLSRFEPLFKSIGIKDEFYGGINKAQNFKTSETRKAEKSKVEMLGHYTPKERAQFWRTKYIPELKGTMLDPNRSKESIFMSLLHYGNEGNASQLMRGYELNESHLQAMWKTLTPKDIQTANSVWKFVDSFWPMIDKQERDLNGISPEKIEGRPFKVTLSDGNEYSLDGGYFPLVYDKNVSFRTQELNQESSLKEMFPSYAGNTATKHNWTEARIGGGDQAPSLKWSVFDNHISDVIHDLAYRKPVIDLHRILNDSDTRAHLQAGLGKSVYEELNPWLKRIAGDRQYMDLGHLETLRWLSGNMTFAELGWKYASAAVHATSLMPATREVGLGYMGRGFKAFSNPMQATKFMWENSEFMHSRWDDAGDRDIKMSISNPKLLNTQKGFWNEMKAMSPVQQRDAFILMRSFDLAVAGPTWYAGYYKAMDGKVKGIDAQDHESSVSYADGVVRDTKGSGAAKDLAPYLAKGGNLGRLFSLFQTQLNVIANQGMNASREFKGDRDYGKLAGNVALIWFGPAMASELLRGKFPSNDEGWLEWGAKAIAKFPFLLNPLTAPIVGYFERGNMNLLPAEEGLKTIADAAKTLALKNSVSDKLRDTQTEWTQKDYENAFMAGGYLTGFPTRGIMNSTVRLHGWMSGEEPHDNPLGGIYSVMTGTKPSE